MPISTRLTAWLAACVFSFSSGFAHAQDVQKSAFVRLCVQQGTLGPGLRRTLGALLDVANGLVAGGAIPNCKQAFDTLSTQDRLDLSGRGLSDLRPLAFLSGVRALDLAGNEIDDLGPLRELEFLESLDLSSNRVRDLRPLADLAYLDEIAVAGNSVELGEFLTACVLRRSDALDAAAKAEVIALTDLAQGRTCQDWSRSLGSLETVSLASKGLTRLDHADVFHSAVHIDLSENALMDVTALATLPNLSSLDLAGNSLAEPSAVRGLDHVSLALSGNPVCTLSDFFDLLDRSLWLFRACATPRAPRCDPPPIGAFLIRHSTLDLTLPSVFNRFAMGSVSHPVGCGMTTSFITLAPEERQYHLHARPNGGIAWRFSMAEQLGVEDLEFVEVSRTFGASTIILHIAVGGGPVSQLLSLDVDGRVEHSTSFETSSGIPLMLSRDAGPPIVAVCSRRVEQPERQHPCLTSDEVDIVLYDSGLSEVDRISYVPDTTGAPSHYDILSLLWVGDDILVMEEFDSTIRLRKIVLSNDLIELRKIRFVPGWNACYVEDATVRDDVLRILMSCFGLVPEFDNPRYVLTEVDLDDLGQVQKETELTALASADADVSYPWLLGFDADGGLIGRRFLKDIGIQIAALDDSGAVLSARSVAIPTAFDEMFSEDLAILWSFEEDLIGNGFWYALATRQNTMVRDLVPMIRFGYQPWTPANVE